MLDAQKLLFIIICYGACQDDRLSKISVHNAAVNGDGVRNRPLRTAETSGVERRKKENHVRSSFNGLGAELFGNILERFAYPDIRKYDIAILGNQDRYIQIIPMAKKVSFVPLLAVYRL